MAMMLQYTPCFMAPPFRFRWCRELNNSRRGSPFPSISCALQVEPCCTQARGPDLYVPPVTTLAVGDSSVETTHGVFNSSLQMTGITQNKESVISGDEGHRKVGGAKSRRMRKRRRAEAKLIIAKKSKNDSNIEHVKKSLDLGKGTSTLTADEQAKLAQGVQDLLAIKAVKLGLERRLGRALTFAEWARAMRMEPPAFYLRHSYAKSCWNTMIKRNLRFVKSIANSYQGTELSTQDLVQAGTEGLIRSCARFDSSKGFKFSTYAYFWIARMIGKAIAKHSHSMRLPERIFFALKKVAKAKKKMMYKKEKPTLESFAAQMGFTVNRSKLLLRLSNKCGPLPCGSDGQRMDHLSDTSIESPETVAYRQMVRTEIEDALQILRPRDRAMLKLRYGLEDGRSKSLQEVGNIFGLSKERIRVIENGIIKTLQTSATLKSSLEESLLYK